MLFLLALVIAVLFAAILLPALRRSPLPFWVIAAVIAGGAVLAGELDVDSDLLLDWVLPLLNTGALAAAFWVLVMWAGALPPGSRAGKRLLSARGELSVFAAILTLGHVLIRGLLYLKLLCDPGGHSDAAFLLTCFIVLLLLIIMLPLTVLSFKGVRRRMQTRRWKRIQKLAYLFYGLIYAHVLVLYLPGALHGANGRLLTVLVYTAVWIAYLVLRLRKRAGSAKPGLQAGNA